MTTPQERMRSIGWGAELLRRLQNEPGIPDDLKALAAQTEISYPSMELLLSLLATSSREFPRDAGRSIEVARNVFEKVQATGAGSEELRLHVLYTLRHFPLAGWSRHADVSARLGHLDDWLAPGLS